MSGYWYMLVFLAFLFAGVGGWLTSVLRFYDQDSHYYYETFGGWLRDHPFELAYSIAGSIVFVLGLVFH